MSITWQYSTDPQIDYALRMQGFAVMNAYLKDLVPDLLHLYRSHDDGQAGVGFRVTFNTKDDTTRRTVLRQAVNLLQTALGPLFPEYRLIYANFLVKEPGHPESAMRVHLDWAICDETLFRGLSTWVALTDTTMENGPMGVLPGSHLEPILARGGQDASFAMFPDLDHPVFQDVTQRYPLLPLEVPIGTVVPYDMRLFHNAFQNNSQSERIALNGVWAPRNAPLEQLFRDAAGNITRHEVDANFFHDFRPRVCPSSPPLPLTAAQEQAIFRFKVFPKTSQTL